MKILYQEKEVNFLGTTYEEIIENKLIIEGNKIIHKVKITRPYDPSDSCDWTNYDDEYSKLYFCEKALSKLYKEKKI